MTDKKTNDSDIEHPFDMSPTHPIWTQMERGIQILLGFSLVTAIHFLGESWGQPNIPYDKLFPAIGVIGIAFIYSLLITPIAGYIGIALRAFTPLPDYRINQIRAILFNLALLVLVIIFFGEASIFISALMEAVGLDPSLPETWDQTP
ncbi:MAG: hypothetical protein COA62_14690 [Rhodobiaceae bacterium]|nr:MAG: hypothetical protein COA62_14690 [Rhodobiaceae bacterium]